MLVVSIPGSHESDVTVPPVVATNRLEYDSGNACSAKYFEESRLLGVLQHAMFGRIREIPDKYPPSVSGASTGGGGRGLEG